MSEHCDKCAELADRYRQENQRLKAEIVERERRLEKALSVARQYASVQRARKAHRERRHLSVAEVDMAFQQITRALGEPQEEKGE